MLGVIRDGLSVLAGSYLPTIEFLVAVAGCGLFVVRLIAGRDVEFGERFLIASGLGAAVLGLLAFVVVVIGHFQPSLLRPGCVLILVFATIVLFSELWLARSAIRRHWYFVAACAVVVVILLSVRLAFLENLILPPYSDSPVHYEIVAGFLHPELSDAMGLSLNTIFRDYYHFGFHSLAAWLSLIGDLSAEEAISLLGQLLLVICPISVYALTYTVTRSHAGAAFAGLLAVIAWWMPAYSVNWGKFPALSSLAVLPAIVAVTILAVRNGTSTSKLLLWGMFLLATAALLHTRILFCLVAVAAAYFVADKIKLGTGMPFPKALLLALLYIVSLLPLYQVLHDYYYGIPVFIVLLILLPFAFQVFPKLSACIFFFTLLLWLGSIVPFPGRQYGQTWLDQPYVEMALYIPFSVIAGAGFAALMQRLPAASWHRPLTATFLIGAVLLNFSPKSLRPDSCCNYFNQDDQRAFQWIRVNTTAHSLFLISAYTAGGTNVGTDAGIWITPLTGRLTRDVLYNVDWNSAVPLAEACRAGATEIYVYVGGKQFSFAMDQPSYGDGLLPAFRSGQTSIYRVVGCQHQ